MVSYLRRGERRVVYRDEREIPVEVIGAGSISAQQPVACKRARCRTGRRHGRIAVHIKQQFVARAYEHRREVVPGAIIVRAGCRDAGTCGEEPDGAVALHGDLGVRARLRLARPEPGDRLGGCGRGLEPSLNCEIGRVEIAYAGRCLDRLVIRGGEQHRIKAAGTRLAQRGTVLVGAGVRSGRVCGGCSRHLLELPEKRRRIAQDRGRIGRERARGNREQRECDKRKGEASTHSPRCRRTSRA